MEPWLLYKSHDILTLIHDKVLNHDKVFELSQNLAYDDTILNDNRKLWILLLNGVFFSDYSYLFLFSFNLLFIISLVSKETFFFEIVHDNDVIW